MTRAERERERECVSAGTERLRFWPPQPPQNMLRVLAGPWLAVHGVPKFLSSGRVNKDACLCRWRPSAWRLLTHHSGCHDANTPLTLLVARGRKSIIEMCRCKASTSRTLTSYFCVDSRRLVLSSRAMFFGSCGEGKRRYSNKKDCASIFQWGGPIARRRRGGLYRGNLIWGEIYFVTSYSKIYDSE